MPEYLTPGVYVEETSYRARSIEGVSTSTLGMAGVARYGPVPYTLQNLAPDGAQPDEPQVQVIPPLVTSYSEFVRAFGDLGDVNDDVNYLALSAREFFDNGGRRLYVARVFAGVDQNAGVVRNESFAKRPVGSGDTPVAEWRARWPGAAGREMQVQVRLRRSKDIIVRTKENGGNPASARVSTVREFDLVELADFDQDRPPKRKDEDVPAADSIRVLRRDPRAGVLKFQRIGAEPGQFEEVPLQGVAGFHLQVDVTVQWGDRIDAYGELALHPDHPRSVLKVLELQDPADELALVWLRAVGGKDNVDPARLLLALLADDSQGYLGGGTDGENPGPDDFKGREADPDDEKLSPTGLCALGEIDDIAIVAMPDTARLSEDESRTAVSFLIEHCEDLRYRIAVVDPPKDSSLAQVREFRAKFDSSYAALYYPWLEILDPTVRPDRGVPAPKIPLPPSGFVAGIYARTDIARGVHKAPANEVINGIIGFKMNVTFDRQSVLNPEGINALRFFEGRSNRVWGARTMSSDPEWKYVNVRRLFIFLEHSIDKATQWAVFEPNNEALWASIRQSVEDFLFAQWGTGALMGTRPEEAYFVRCDRTTMTQNDLDNGRLICLVGVAPTYPAEFVIFRIGQWTADARRS